MSEQPTKPIDDGGPAADMSLRDYFAARAPLEPAFWFVPSTGPAPDWSERSGIKMPHGCTASVGCCEKCDEYFKQQAIWQADIDRRKSVFELRRLVEWPWAYADQMLSARKAVQP